MFLNKKIEPFLKKIQYFTKNISGEKRAKDLFQILKKLKKEKFFKFFLHN